MLFAILFPLSFWLLHHRRWLRELRVTAIDSSGAIRTYGADLYSLRKLSNYIHTILYS